jgi:glycosyltransferase involved in cell wall biosynthesis
MTSKSISLCSFVKNEEACIANMISSVYWYVDEIILVDTGSTDNTIEVAKNLCDMNARAAAEFAYPEKVDSKLKVYNHEFVDFAETRTFTANKATCAWVLMLDADEQLQDPQMLQSVIEQGSLAFAFPRKRWLDLDKERQTEVEAYPDWQVRLFKNNQGFVYKRPLHEYFHGTAVHHFSAGPVIDHFHDVFKTDEKKKHRAKLYKELSVLAGVEIEGGKEL